MTLPYPAGHPSQYPFGQIRHYYGDVVRALFITLAVLCGISIPTVGDLQTTAPIGVLVIVVLLVLAGLTSPHGKIVLVLNAVTSGALLVGAQLTALGYYAREFYVAFALLEAVSIVAMVALYYSVKTVRAKFAGKIGKVESPEEFATEAASARPTEFE